MPKCFCAKFKDKVAIIIDCFEVFIECLSGLLTRAATWSSYKHHVWNWILLFNPFCYLTLIHLIVTFMWSLISDITLRKLSERERSDYPCASIVWAGARQQTREERTADSILEFITWSTEPDRSYTQIRYPRDSTWLPAAVTELQRKRRVRAGHRGSAMWIQGQTTAELASSTPNLDNLSTLKLSLEEKSKAVKELDAEIIAIVGDVELDDEIVQADEFHEKNLDTFVQINRALTPAATSSAPPTTTPSSSHPHGAKVKLPMISLPHFNGELTRCLHSGNHLSQQQGTNRCRQFQLPQVFVGVHGSWCDFCTCSVCCKLQGSSWDLAERVWQQTFIISKHMEMLFAAGYVASDQNLKDLRLPNRTIYDTTESHLRSLKSLGIDPASYGAMLSPVLLNKLPPELSLIVSRKTLPTGLNIENLLSSFEEELAARERASVSKPSYSQLLETEREVDLNLLRRLQGTGSALLRRLQGTGSASKSTLQLTVLL